ADHGVATAAAELAAYKPTEFKVAVEPDRPAYVRGDKATFVTRGDYLFGAPMKGGKARVSVRRGQGYFALPLGEKDPEAFIWNDQAYWADKPEAESRASVVTSTEGALNAKGELTTSASLTMPEKSGRE